MAAERAAGRDNKLQLARRARNCRRKSINRRGPNNHRRPPARGSPPSTFQGAFKAADSEVVVEVSESSRTAARSWSRLGGAAAVVCVHDCNAAATR